MIRRICFILAFILMFSLAAFGAETVIRFDADDYESSSLWDSLNETKQAAEKLPEQLKESESEPQAESESQRYVTELLWGSLSETQKSEPEAKSESEAPLIRENVRRKKKFEFYA